MHPGYILGIHKATEKTCGEDVVALAVHRALHHIRNLALEIRVEIGIKRKIPDALAALRASLEELSERARGDW